MLKFVKHTMENIEGVEIYPILSFLIFFTFFVLATVYILKKDKKTIDEISRIPLNNQNTADDENA